MGFMLLITACLLVAGYASAELNTMSIDLVKHSSDHHTDKFRLSLRELIIRRGGNVSVTAGGKGDLQEISIEIKLNDERVDAFDLDSNRTGLDRRTSWLCSIDGRNYDPEQNKTFMNITIQVPVRAGVGQYSFSLAEKGSDDQAISQKATILFNPWHTEDETFMISRTEREEYVLNDMGKVYLGSSFWFNGKQWVFGQFHENVLPAVMLLLSKIPDVVSNKSILADPVRLSRAISAGVNANDGFGVIEGNWGSSFDGGTPPSEWSSSVAILEEYLMSGGEAVKYGQCWVFAAVTTTVLRTLGIPARPITTFGSAHDTDDSLTIDHFYDEDMFEISGEYGSDSIWNFHAWTEAWMSRADIPDRKAGGWQVVDATPQELSDGIFQAGPASVSGVKRGDIDKDYDMHFVFSEVQSQQVRWQIAPETPMGWKRLSAEMTSIAPKIVTKRVGSLSGDFSTGDAVDVTYQYKYEDETERRFALMNAAKRAGVELLLIDVIPANGVFFEFAPMNKTAIGEFITGFVRMVNTLNETVTVNAKIRIDSTFYNAVKVNRIASIGKVLQLEPGQEEVLQFDIPFEDYYTKLVDQCLITISSTAIVKETDQIWVQDSDFQLKTPGLNISLLGEARDGEITHFNVTFLNTMPIFLTECQLRIHGTRAYTDLALSDIAPGDTVSYQIDVRIDHVPLVIADMDCTEVVDMTGSTIVTFAT